MSAQAVLAIDQGTSGTKAIVVDPEGQVLGSASTTVRPVYGPDGSVEQDPDELLDSVIGAGRSGVPPMKPSTFGTSLTRCQVSSSISICTST